MRRTTNIVLHDCHPKQTDLLGEVLEGLCKKPKTLPPKLFYDERGSQLFEEITRLPEYYLTRAEIGILDSFGDELVEFLGASPNIIELGSGSSKKIRILLDQIQGGATYVAVDIALDHLRDSTEALAADYPNVQVIAVCADYTGGFDLPELPGQGRRIIFFPGSNLGNLTGPEANAFFRAMAGLLRRGDGMLLGVDRKKDPAVLHAAYNDSRAVTAEFNLNVLRRINRELGADFNLFRFTHVAFYNEMEGRIEMHLRSERRQSVHIAGNRFDFEPGETIHTENSYKYNDEDLRRLIAGSGFDPVQSWSDQRQWFSVYSLRVY